MTACSERCGWCGRCNRSPKSLARVRPEPSRGDFILIHRGFVRAGLPRRRRLSRVPSILRELLSLRYHEYANGFKSAAKDLVS